MLGELGFPASSREVRRLGLRARVVKRVLDPLQFNRSFAATVMGEEMYHGRERFPRRFGGGGHHGVQGKRSCRYHGDKLTILGW